MANVVYPKYLQKLLSGDTNAALNSAEGSTGVFAALIDTAVDPYSAADEFYSSLVAGGGVIGTDQEILTKTVLLGLFDGTNLTFPTVTGASAEAIVLYRKNGGANTTWPLILFMDTGVTGLPVTPNGLDIVITWDAAGIFHL